MAAKVGTIAVVLLLALLGAGCGSDPPPEPPPAPGPVFIADADLVGCYEVVWLKWETLTSRLGGPAVEPPQSFFLSTDPLPDGERRIKSNTAAHPYAAWRIKEELVFSARSGEPSAIRILELSWRAEATVIVSVQRHPRDARLWQGSVTRFWGFDRAQGWITLRRSSAEDCSRP